METTREMVNEIEDNIMRQKKSRKLDSTSKMVREEAGKHNKITQEYFMHGKVPTKWRKVIEQHYRIIGIQIPHKE